MQPNNTIFFNQNCDEVLMELSPEVEKMVCHAFEDEIKTGTVEQLQNGQTRYILKVNPAKGRDLKEMMIDLIFQLNNDKN